MGRRSDVLLDLIMMCKAHQMNGCDQIMFSGGPDDNELGHHLFIPVNY